MRTSLRFTTGRVKTLSYNIISEHAFRKRNTVCTEEKKPFQPVCVAEQQPETLSDLLSFGACESQADQSWTVKKGAQQTM